MTDLRQIEATRLSREWRDADDGVEIVPDGLDSIFQPLEAGFGILDRFFKERGKPETFRRRESAECIHRGRHRGDGGEFIFVGGGGRRRYGAVGNFAFKRAGGDGKNQIGIKKEQRDTPWQ